MGIRLLNYPRSSITDKWLECSPSRGRFRRLVFLLSIWLFVIVGNFLNWISYSNEVIDQWILTYPNLAFIPKSLLGIIWLLVPHGQTLDYLLIPIGIFWLVFITAARYVQKVKGIENFFQAVHYLISAFFGMFVPVMKIPKQEEDGSHSGGWIQDIGGPGYVDIDSNYVLALESITSPTRFLTKGKNYITRFEKIRETINLSDQPLKINEFSVFTKDRVDIKVLQIAARYKVASSRLFSRTREKQNSSMISEEAIYRLVYHRFVGKTCLIDWQQSVQEIIQEAIRETINDILLLKLMSPGYSKEHPRELIKYRVLSTKTKGKLLNIGTTLEWFDFENIEIPEKYRNIEPLNSWHAYWIKRAAEMRALGESQRLKQQDESILQRQAEVLIKIAEIFQEPPFSERITGSNQELFWRAVSSLIASIK